MRVDAIGQSVAFENGKLERSPNGIRQIRASSVGPGNLLSNADFYPWIDNDQGHALGYVGSEFWDGSTVHALPSSPTALNNQDDVLCSGQLWQNNTPTDYQAIVGSIDTYFGGEIRNLTPMAISNRKAGAANGDAMLYMVLYGQIERDPDKGNWENTFFIFTQHADMTWDVKEIANAANMLPSVVNNVGMIAGQAANTASTSNANGAGHAVVLVPVQLTQSNYPTPSRADNTTDSGVSGTPQTISTSGNGVALITGSAVMPQLLAQVAGFNSSGMSVDWSLTVTSERSQRGTKDNISIPAAGGASHVINVPINQPWNIAQYYPAAPQDCFGGNVTLNFQVKNAAGTYLMAAPQSLTFKIRGLNPLDATAKAYIRNQASSQTSYPDVYQFAWAVVQHESREGNTVYNQFNSSGSTAELPDYGAPDGWGIAQLDTPLGVSASTDEVYNWQDNISGFFAEMAEKLAAQQRFFHAVANAYPNDPVAQNPPQSALYGTSISALAAGAITLYNGVKGCPSTTLGHTTYQNPWTFTHLSSGSRWMYHANKYDYLHQVLQEYQGEAYNE